MEPLTVCACHSTFLMRRISQHFERLLLDYRICLMLNNIQRIFIIQDINYLYTMSSKSFEIISNVSKRTNIVGQHFYASPTCCRDTRTAQHCWLTMLARFAPPTDILSLCSLHNYSLLYFIEYSSTIEKHESKYRRGY